MRPAAKAKISVTVEQGLVDHLDEGVRRKRYVSRSAAIETALERWWHVERRRLRDAEIEAYYGSQTVEERTEDREWAEFSGAAFAEVSKREPRTVVSRRQRKRKS